MRAVCSLVAEGSTSGLLVLLTLLAAVLPNKDCDVLVPPPGLKPDAPKLNPPPPAPTKVEIQVTRLRRFYAF